MTDAQRWERIKQLFRDAQNVPAGERATWLAQQDGDGALLDEVRRLLSAQQVSHGILEGDAAAALKRMGTAAAAVDLSGSRIGSLRLLRLIGEGGMGSVYLAERDGGDFVQRVALKLVRADFAGREARERFLRERSFLARLVHPHIAQFHDGGLAADGNPYFTLEYVEGEPITTWCDAHRLDVRQRVGLALQVCAAVAYAHRNLIVHRDLKPSNILVSADGEAKLLDFGIAKLLDPEAAEGQTATHSRLMTPEYAAPEQVLGEPITTATDVYAIGVLLYQLLSSRLPYARADSGAVSFQKAVVEEVPEPVHRAISRTVRNGGATLTGEAVAAARGTSVPALRRSLRGDLDRIVQRCLAKRPEARYQSVGELAADLRAYREGRAISGSSRRYRMRVFVRRHWLPLGAAATLVLVLLASGAAILWQSHQVAREAQNTLQVKNFLFGLFTAVDPHEAKGRDVSARELLDRGAERIAEGAALDAEQRAEIEATLGRTYYQLGLFDQADKLQQSALKALAGESSRKLLLARTQSQRADTLLELGDLKGAAALATEASARLENLADATLADRADALRTQTMVAMGQRDFDAAKRYADAELALVNLPEADSRLRYAALMMAGGASWGLETYPEAEARFREALAVALADPHPDELNIAKARTNIGMALQTQSRYEEAEGLQKLALATDEKMLGAEHAATMAVRRDLALCEYRLGRYAPAQVMMEQTLAAQRKKLGNDHPAIAGTEINLGGLLIERGAADAAEPVLAEAVAIFEKKYGPAYQGVIMAVGNLAAAHLAMGKLDAADAELERVSADEEKKGNADKDRALTLMRLGELQRSRGNFAAAVELHRRAVAGARELHGENHRFTANAHDQLARSLRDGGDNAGAEQEFRAALASYAGYLPNGEHPMAATTSYELGQLLVRTEATRAEGLRLLGAAVAMREKFLGADDPATQKARTALKSAQGGAKA